MKRKFVFLLLSFILYLLSFTPIHAQGLSYQKYSQEYDLYRQTYQSYTTSKNKWLTYRTLQSQNEALVNGKVFLKQRVKVVLAYLSMLSERTRTSGGFSQSEQNLIIAKIEVETAWLSDHILKYDTAATLQDLERLSDQFTDRYKNVIQFIGLTSAGQILANKEKILTTNISDITIRLGQKIAEAKAEGFDVSLPERWLLEAQNKTDQSQQKQDESVSIITNLHGENSSGQYNQALFILTEANQYLREAASYLKEVVRNIKGE